MRISFNVDWNRLLAAIVALSYLIGLSFAGQGIQAFVEVAVSLLLPLALIWYSDELGEFTGVVHFHNVSQTSPAGLIQVIGWIFLLLPAVIWICS